MNLQQIEYFISLAETEHMTRSAELLNTTQPNVSYAITQLETSLGVPLFKKAGRNIKLTKYGKTFYDYAKESLNLLRLGKNIIADEIDPNRGHVSLGFTYTMGSRYVPAIVKSFQEKAENSSVTFSFLQGNSSDIINMLREEEIDLGLSSYIEECSDIQFDPFIKQEMVVVVPNDHPLAEKDTVSFKELDGLPFINFGENTGIRHHIDTVLETAGVKPDIIVSVEEDSSMLGFVSHGFGVTIMPDITITDAFPVKKIKINDQFQSRLIYLAKLKEAYRSPSLEKFYNFSRNYFNKMY